MRPSAALLPGTTFAPAALLAPAQALIVYRARVALHPAGVESVPLAQAVGRVLAEDRVAEALYPSHARSTMDGFAVRSADGSGARRIVDEVRMGAPPAMVLGSGEAARIPTGGALPDGADAVVPIEDADEVDGMLRPHAAPETGACLTQAGDDMRPGDRVAQAGRRVDGALLGVLATLGVTVVPVYRRPRIAIISTGDELVPPSRVPGRGQVRDSNRYALAGALAALGIEAVQCPIAPDRPADLAAALREALAAADGVLLSGGSSVGVRDLVPRTIDSLGNPGVVVHGLRVKPGKPTVLAALEDKPVIGLPGNPASSLMILRTIAAPLLLELTGERPRLAATPSAVAAETIAGRPGWTWFVPVTLHAHGAEVQARPLVLRSAHTSLLARSDGFVVVPEDRPRIEAGERVTVHPLSGAGFDR